MSFRAKLILVSVLLIVLTVAMAGFLGYRESKSKIKQLARELLIAQTEQAFALCAHHNKTSSVPSEELMQEIAALQIAETGYMAVIKNADGPDKGILIIHPEEIGTNLYNNNFKHIKKVIDDIDKAGQQNGFSGYTFYRQGTKTLGRLGDKKIGYYKYFAPWKWVILATGYEDDVFSSRDQLRATLFQIVILVMLVGVIIVFGVIRVMFKPVQRLTEITKEVARGNWNVSINYQSNDEIGALSQAFDRMVKSLRENASLWHEFNVARDMQAQMLPASSPKVDGLSIKARSIPAKEVGGDFYDFLALEDGRFGVVIGDVSGHGLSAAMVMTAAMGTVRFAAEGKTQTNEVLNMVSARLNKDTQSNMFVALFYGIFDPKTKQLHYTNAGQTMPYLHRNGKTEFLPQAENSDRFPLGIVPTTIYEQLTIDLHSGDRLVFYTDGIVDAMNGNFESYGFDRFSESIRRNSDCTPADAIERLVAGMKLYSGDANFHDDVTLVIVEIE